MPWSPPTIALRNPGDTITSVDEQSWANAFDLLFDEMGTDPKAGYTSVTARLVAIESGVGILFPSAGTTTTVNHHYNGSSHAVIIQRNAGNPSNGNVLLVTADDLGTDANPMDSTIGISGYETAKGTVKITHHRPVAAVTVADGNASILSLLLDGAGSTAQGIFLDTAIGGTYTGKLLNIRSETADRLVLTGAGQLQLPVSGSTGGIVVGGDCELFRTSAGIWRTNDEFDIVRGSAGTVAFVATVSGSSPANFVIYADGKMEWGDFNTVRDVNLYRSAADVLKTDDSLVVGGSLTTTPTVQTITTSGPVTGDIVDVDATSGDLVATLPDASTRIGRPVYVTRKDSATGNDAQVWTSSGDTANGTTVLPLLAQWDSYVFHAISANEWRVFSLETTSLESVSVGGAITKAVTLVTAGASDRTMDLPTAIGAVGVSYTIKKVDSGIGTVIIDPNGSQTIDGAATLVLASQYQSATLVSDNANWMMV
jgi:hypothetical protein